MVKMRAIACTQYGPPDVLKLVDVEKPVPKDNEILIKINAANIFPGDCEMRRFEVHSSLWVVVRLALGILRPRREILGQELSGVIEAVGKEVTEFVSGDKILGCTQIRLGG